MPIALTDLVQYASASMPEDDASASGGAIDATDRIELTQLTANSVIAAVSDGADVRTITVTGRLPSSVIDTEAIVLTGAVEVVGLKQWGRVLKIEASAADGARTVTIRQGAGGAAIATITPTELTRRTLFIGAASEAGATTRYEKAAWRNNHGTLALTTAALKLSADPSTKFEIGVAVTKGDAVSVANRKTAPAGITFVDDGVSQSIPTGNLGAAENIGLWYKLSLGAADAPQKTTVSSELSGNTA